MRVHSQSLRNYKMVHKKHEGFFYPNMIQKIETTEQKDVILIVENMADKIKVCDPQLNVLGFCRCKETLQTDAFLDYPFTSLQDLPSRKHAGPPSESLQPASIMKTIVLDIACTSRFGEVASADPTDLLSHEPPQLDGLQIQPPLQMLRLCAAERSPTDVDLVHGEPRSAGDCQQRQRSEDLEARQRPALHRETPHHPRPPRLGDGRPRSSPLISRSP